MILAIFVRRLRPGVSFSEFKEAWVAEPNHFGRPVRVSHAQRMDDDREIVSYALFEATRGEVEEALRIPAVAQREHARHSRIDQVIECTVLKGLYEVVDTTELT
ncbi:hypothetical protein K4749_12380 [Streptomyces sp. TRM72054]|uniref:hypothetical protein n=1 Tax=Streptomyces sp. TRM72054 TaxID=2870562 RepID=UPI001C8BB6E8|nr:hypothetical protein [Streptomyces sp. TRM72054]MBX9394377.1 hypothetical protein [Streptomyces sp. TRM72054]